MPARKINMDKRSENHQKNTSNKKFNQKVQTNQMNIQKQTKKGKKEPDLSGF
jgi:hypothetical protein